MGREPSFGIGYGCRQIFIRGVVCCVVVCWEAKRDQVGFRRGQRQDKGVQLSWSKLAALTAAVSQP